jgi:hypothetical protein
MLLGSTKDEVKRKLIQVIMMTQVSTRSAHRNLGLNWLLNLKFRF